MKNNNWSEQAIAEAAYYIWQKNGCQCNTSTQDWYAAIEQLNNLANTKKTSLSSKSSNSSKKSILSSKTLSSTKKSILSSLTSRKTSSCKTTSATKKSSKSK
ncbi:MAG: DUF2934 domain-containing protein [Alphaproteobacteria bacterium]|jgi:hypothetical protein|nr:DUF2934 domain-containing protein [Alphaproteobacteria bacterium]